MRKLIAQELVSLDGFFSGANGEIDWHIVDDEYSEYALDLLNTVSMILFGRVTYQLMASYWPNESNDIAHKMNSSQKIVFSKTLESVHWQNTQLVSHNYIDQIQNLKQQPGKDLLILGSAELVSLLLNKGLIDELHLTVVPIVLGCGKPLFKDIDKRMKMDLYNSKTLRCGSVQLFYQTN
ncbi:dihydrofolate reductase [Neobacillus piezotolerans]|uniref:Dihydrofolate reductase n=1 Tax=Neobacillus piezotolerans TaxID=2259171 RepID=A0A3D8GUM4_9BACI|nr:dihydrofolate reductase family protein [Neobacillus piezotolerans]RDU37919.1 dihydrofolate reductase [Neobacillus piezotolerans]